MAEQRHSLEHDNSSVIVLIWGDPVSSLTLPENVNNICGCLGCHSGGGWGERPGMLLNVQCIGQPGPTPSNTGPNMAEGEHRC